MAFPGSHKVRAAAAALLMFLAIGTRAHAAILVTLDGMPLPDLYDVFLLTESTANFTDPKLAVVPRKLEFEADPASGRPRFGLQYDFEPDSAALVQLTAGLRLHFDPAEVNQVLTAAKASTGLPALKVAASGPFTIRVALFVPKADGSILQMPAASQASVGSTIAASVDLSSVDRDLLVRLLSGDSSAGGFVATLNSPSAIYDRKNDYADWKAVVDWAIGQGVLTVRSLTFPSDAKAKSRPDIRLAIAEALGLPGVVAKDADYVVGWDLKVQGNADSLAKLLSSAAVAGTLTKVASQYVGSAMLPMNSACTKLAKQIVDLSSGEQGCSGLKKAASEK
jgi:hypothetical protein